MHNGAVGGICNIGANNEWANIDLARRILRIMGKGKNLLTSVPARPGHHRRYAIDSTKLTKELGWAQEREVDFWGGLKDTVENYLSGKSPKQGQEKRGQMSPCPA